MNSPSKDAADILAADSGLGLTQGVDLFIGREPTAPDNVVTLYDTTGSAPDMTAETLERPSLTIKIRNNNYSTGWQLGKLIFELLKATTNHVQGGSRYLIFLPTGSGPGALGLDDNDRSQFSMSFDIMRTF